MGLVVPLLRLGMVFLNVYETFKTLKAPPPSARNGGQPSVRALSQRKRDMKGCLTIWIVWCCFSTYERLIERIVSLFIPFYDELKSLAIIFLMLTRARSAEPIFLHLIRPALRPHAPTLDMLLDLMCMFGDIIYLGVTHPYNRAQAWWKGELPFDTDVLGSKSENIRTITDVGNAAKTADEQLEDEDEPVAHPYYGVNAIDDLKYPEFPSAYPPTPSVTQARFLPPMRGPYVPPIPEEDSDDDEPQHHDRHPFTSPRHNRRGSGHSGRRRYHYSDEEDDSDVPVSEEMELTLQTPMIRNGRRIVHDDSNSTRSRPALSTIHTPSSFHTRSSSQETSSSMEYPINGKKRLSDKTTPPRPPKARPAMSRREDALPRRKYSPGTKKPTARQPLETRTNGFKPESNAHDEEEEVEEESVDDAKRSASMKRRRIALNSRPLLSARASRAKMNQRGPQIAMTKAATMRMKSNLAQLHPQPAPLTRVSSSATASSSSSGRP